MTSTEVLTLRLDKATTKRLARLSAATERTRARLAADAIAKYLDDNAWQVEAIEEGVRAADRGELVPHAEVLARMRAWKAPRAGRQKR